MKNTKTIVTTFALILMLTSTSLAILTTVSAQDPVSEWKTYIYVCSTPITGVGQEMFIVTWIDRMPPDVGETAAGARASYSGITVTIRAPDGTQETLEMGDTDPVGGGYLLYTPTQIGEYTLRADFPGQWKNNTGSWARWYTPSQSWDSTFTVQADPITTWPNPPLPTDYWMRPISGPSHWSEVAGNWLGSYAQVYPQAASGGTSDRYGYGAAPGSAHILWTKQHYPSGSIMDERFGNHVYTLNHYQDVAFDGQLIVDGVIHYTPQYTGHWGSGNAVGSFGWAGLDLYTGEQLFNDPYAIKPEFGQIYLYNSPNQHGGFSYLWRTNGVELPETVTREPYPGIYRGAENETVTLTTIPGTETWEMIDAYTRNRVCYVANVSTSGTTVYGKDGSYLKYLTVNLGDNANPNYYLQCYNVSAIRTMLAGDYASGTQYWQWRPQWGGHSNYQFRWRENVNAFHDWNDQNFFLNVSIPSLQGPRNPRSNQTASIDVVREGEYVIFSTSGANDENGLAPSWLLAVSLEPGREGEKLWETSIIPPQDETGDYQGVSFRSIYPEDEVVIYNFENLLKWYAYDMRSGQLLWESEPENPYGYYGMYDNYYDGMLLTSGRYGGIMNAYNIRTGEIIWTYVAEGSGTETPYGNSIFRNEMIADGKIYLSAAEHSASSPLWRGPNLRCIDAHTGEEIWKILFWGENSANLVTADGILVAFNWYDGQVYGFGRGPSATTVEALPKAIQLGTSVMIEGTVTDQTPTGRRNINNELQFTLKDTPAVSDEDMQAWMEYKFMGQAYPMNAKGVTVNLWAIDPNGNFQDIGQVVSDLSGTFGKSWIPPVPGEYYITASFDGSASYGSSSATCHFVVDEAPSPGAPIESEPATPAPTTPEPATPEPSTPEPATPEPTTPEPATPEPTTPEPTEPAEAPFITTEIAIVAVVAVVAVIGVVSFWVLRKRK